MLALRAFGFRFGGRAAISALVLAVCSILALPSPPGPGRPARAESPGGAVFLPLALRSAAVPAPRRTLILSHLPAIAEHFQLAAADPEMAGLRERLQALAAHPAVEGQLVLDLTTGADPAVRTAYLAWAANLDPTAVNRKANTLARALRDWIWRKRAAGMPELRYVVIAGDDRVVPFYRLRIDPPQEGRADWTTEDEYFQEGQVGAGTTTGAALAADLTLNDDYYATPELDAWGSGDTVLPVPELAVGRLVERPGDMAAVVDAFLEQPVRPLEHSLLAGYDFMQDGLEAVEPRLAAVLPPERRTRLIGSHWTADELKTRLKTGQIDLFYFALHASHFRVDTPNNGAILAQEIAATGDFAGSVVIGLACHAGLNTPGAEHAQALDFPEAWLQRGATFIGSPGWAYGGAEAEGLRYQEVLMAAFTDRLLAGDGTALGDALVMAKRRYFEERPEPTAFHVKTVAGTVLYGLPMARLAIEPRPSSAAGRGTSGLARGTSGG